MVELLLNQPLNAQWSLTFDGQYIYVCMSTFSTNVAYTTGRGDFVV